MFYENKSFVTTSGRALRPGLSRVRQTAKQTVQTEQKTIFVVNDQIIHTKYQFPFSLARFINFLRLPSMLEGESK